MPGLAGPAKAYQASPKLPSSIDLNNDLHPAITRWRQYIRSPDKESGCSDVTSNSRPALWAVEDTTCFTGVALLMPSCLSASDLPFVRSYSPSNRTLAHLMEVDVP